LRFLGLISQIFDRFVTFSGGILSILSGSLCLFTCYQKVFGLSYPETIAFSRLDFFFFSQLSLLLVSLPLIYFYLIWSSYEIHMRFEVHLRLSLPF
jgi:hypothetical protein